METKKYYAEFIAYHNTRSSKPYEDTNKARLISDIREIAEGNTPKGGECYWIVYDGTKTIVADGGNMNGRRWRNSPRVGMKMSELFE